jgi:hypothetical protein
MQQRPSEKKTKSYLEDKFSAFMQSEVYLLRSQLATGPCHKSREQSPLSHVFFLQNPFPQIKKEYTAEI